MKRFLVLSLVAGSLCSGCATLEDFKYREANRGRAAVAWREARACMPRECITPDYEAGFKAGYFAVATGNSSCPPVVPPPRYFHARYQSVEGQCKVNQWYQGFQAGAIAADRDGRPLWATVPTQDGPGIACPSCPNMCGESCPNACASQCPDHCSDTFASDVIAAPMMAHPAP